MSLTFSFMFIWLVWTQSQDRLQLFQSQGVFLIFSSRRLDRRYRVTFGVIVPFAGSDVPGKNARGLGVTWKKSKLGGLCLQRGVTWRPDPWPATCSSTWSHRASCEGKRSGIGGRQADTVRGGVWHHAAVVTAASTAAAGHPGFLFEVLSEAASQPRLLYLRLHLRTRGRRQTEGWALPQLASLSVSHSN